MERSERFGIVTLVVKTVETIQTVCWQGSTPPFMVFRDTIILNKSYQPEKHTMTLTIRTLLYLGSLSVAGFAQTSATLNIAVSDLQGKGLDQSTAARKTPGSLTGTPEAVLDVSFF